MNSVESQKAQQQLEELTKATWECKLELLCHHHLSTYQQMSA